ncbi:MAG: protease modulator HflC [Paracoccaceae bacterium]|nr:protease modulator HflC [Paracoccaceae bacterium]MDE2674442.1 protease modulator HflC [Paracoccaceae bacterium]MXZ49466.1 protease modulator HflC [Paracoccaceae bacterium]MYF46560.1 protease modulator HflC [Paracoccaceae bacterium]MYG10470.1 protease modulator HflC [Paracoccaceae bacterium]
MNRNTIILGVLALIVAGALSAIFIVDEREKALVLQFGQVKQVKETPGLAFKIPLIQEVVRYEDRILSLETQSLEVTPLDDRRLVVDAFARYRIADVVQFREAVGVEGSAESRLRNVLNASTREVLGSVTSGTILSADRAGLMSRIRDTAKIEASNLGLEIVDVRLKRTDLPSQNLEATFARMRAEREREAADEIARGEEAAQKVRAQADRTQVEIVSEAQKEAEITRGLADAQRNRIYADAFNQDPEFFQFYRTLRAYELSFQSDNTTLLIDPEGEFFNYFKGSTQESD